MIVIAVKGWRLSLLRRAACLSFTSSPDPVSQEICRCIALQQESDAQEVLHHSPVYLVGRPRSTLSKAVTISYLLIGARLFIVITLENHSLH